MKIAGRREVLHVYDLSENDKVCLRELGFSHFDTDICENEMWEREDNFYVEDSQQRYEQLKIGEVKNNET